MSLFFHIFFFSLADNRVVSSSATFFFKSAPSFFHHLVSLEICIFYTEKSLSNEPAQTSLRIQKVGRRGFQNVGVTKAMGTSTCGFFQCLATIGSFGCDAKWGHVDDRWWPVIAPLPPSVLLLGVRWWWPWLILASTFNMKISKVTDFFGEVEEFGGG